MKYQVVLPTLSVDPNVNYSRRLIVKIGGGLRLDYVLDEKAYDCKFEIGENQEFRCEVWYPGETYDVESGTVIADSKAVGVVFKHERFTIVANPDLMEPDVEKSAKEWYDFQPIEDETDEDETSESPFI